MLKPSKIIYLFFLSLLVSSKTQANEQASSPGAAKPIESYSGAQSEEWMKAEAELNVLKAKMDAQYALVQNLLPQKESEVPHSKSPNVSQKRPQEKTAELNAEFAKYKELVEEYNKKLKDFEIRYPEKGQVLGRKYPRIRNHEIKSLEKSLTLEGRIQKLNKKIKSQYGQSPESPAQEEADKNVQHPKPHAEPNEKPSLKRKDVTDKIIIVK